MSDQTDGIRQILAELLPLLHAEFARPASDPSGPLAQTGLRDGDQVVLDYLEHNEPGLAFEHLIYMIREPALPVTPAVFRLIERTGRAMGLPPTLWADLRCGP